jgi:DNA polymerase I-like protein with 3'-5' exonuclease and polymerase domains
MGLARSLDISADQAIIYIERAREIYSKAFSFVEKHQQQAVSDGYVTDIFGRKRFFVSGESYKARNFVIQSPSALICIEALVKLHAECKDLYKIAFHVHDGYFLALNSEKLQDAFFTAKQILESKTNYMPELQLKVSAKVGRTIDKMVLLKKKEKVI